MGHSHGGGHSHGEPIPLADRVTQMVWIVVGVCTAVVVLGLVLLWPRGADPVSVDPLGLESDPVAVEVTSRDVAPCSYDPLLGCLQYEIMPTEGELEGQRLTFEQSIESTIGEGDRILVLIDTFPDGTRSIVFYDFERGTPLLLLTLLFVTAILVLGGWRGLGALAGLAMSLFVIVAFALPALLDGSNAVVVALVASGAIAVVALLLAHGFNVATAVALLSTLAALGVTGILAWIFVWSSNFTGLTDETVGYLDLLGTPVDPRGLLLAGILIGSLGVLDDVTVTQVSAVWELKRAKPDAGAVELYRRGVRIGRDHISSTVNTLVLAYAGAALPLLLLFQEAGQSLGSVATREIVAVEVVRALVGSIGLVSAVPISTLLAARIVAGAELPSVDHGPDHPSEPASPG
ncbi:MAG: YibE/F family protein [Ilumatobacter sp.]|jgi:uncharacterized membrane protein|uniref:YibE/F family protein n=1 Tax=Ilumatobacter sp. TaxID=1967498 RepID=UPI00391B275B